MKEIPCPQWSTSSRCDCRGRQPQPKCTKCGHHPSSLLERERERIWAKFFLGLRQKGRCVFEVLKGSGKWGWWEDESNVCFILFPIQRLVGKADAMPFSYQPFLFLFFSFLLFDTLNSIKNQEFEQLRSSGYNQKYKNKIFEQHSRLLCLELSYNG